MKYYYREHILGYQTVQAEGRTAWHEIHDGKPFDDFPSRAFLEAALPQLSFPTPQPAVLEVGCGTGPGACFLAQRGFRVHGIDIIPAAIEIARRLSADRGLDIHYEVLDICDLPHAGKPYHIILDSYCLQGIVTDDDRQRVFSNVRARLHPEGYYLVSTAMFDPTRFSHECTVPDHETGVLYHRYGEHALFDARTAIVYVELPEGPHHYEGAMRIRGEWYLPNRRHLNPPALRAELEAAGFRVRYQDGGNVICSHRP